MMSVLLLASASAALAGQYQMMPGPTPDADALAANMRILGANPVDLPALLDAADLTLKLGDVDASVAFLARAERIAPADGRIKAGRARALVELGRPGEALRLFMEAERLGYGVGNFAAERALAYDLIGEQERAQRDYRRALKSGPDDETQRRYALSLGISGKRDLALDQIDSLVRRSDRAAWRVRAFILAMSGDVSEAERIATSMLPGAMADGLLRFFQILPTLGATDRAFAVHFGEVQASPERIADARLVPSLPALLPEPGVPVQVATALPAPTAASAARDRKRRGRRPPAVEVATAVPPPVVKPQLPAPPRIVMLTPIPVTPLSVPTRVASVAPIQSAPGADSPPPSALSRAPSTPPIKPGRPTQLAKNEVRAGRTPLDEPPLALSPPPSVAPAAPAMPMPVPTTTQPPLPTPIPPPAPLPERPPQQQPIAAVPSDGSTSPVTVVAEPPPVPDPVVKVATVEPTKVDSAPVAPDRPVLTASARARPQPIASEDSILARIVAGIGVPAEELGVAPVKSAKVETEKAREIVVEAPSKQPPAIDKKAAAKKALADKAAAEKKLEDKRLAQEKLAKAKALKAAPARAWVQVAGGANVRDLPKAWAKLRDKVPAMFKGRSAYSTPLRFTNRLLTGPFKNEDEAQNFVNQIAKSGLTGFVFTSEPGQKVDKLPPQ